MRNKRRTFGVVVIIIAVAIRMVATVLAGGFSRGGTVFDGNTAKAPKVEQQLSNTGPLCREYESYLAGKRWDPTGLLRKTAWLACEGEKKLIKTTVEPLENLVRREVSKIKISGKKPSEWTVFLHTQLENAYKNNIKTLDQTLQELLYKQLEGSSKQKIVEGLENIANGRKTIAATRQILKAQVDPVLEKMREKMKGKEDVASYKPFFLMRDIRDHLMMAFDNLERVFNVLEPKLLAFKNATIEPLLQSKDKTLGKARQYVQNIGNALEGQGQLLNKIDAYSKLLQTFSL